MARPLPPSDAPITDYAQRRGSFGPKRTGYFVNTGTPHGRIVPYAFYSGGLQIFDASDPDDPKIGETGVDPATIRAVSGGIEPQTEQACRNMAATLARFGLDLSHVVKLTIFLTDISMLKDSGLARARHFPRTLPSSAIGVKELAHPDLLIEIEGLAAIPDPTG